MKLLTLMFLCSMTILPFVFAEQANPATLVEVVDAGNTMCPISGDEVAPEVSYVHEGKRFHFCCAGCVKKFKKNPPRYISQMAEGKVGNEPMGDEHAGHAH